MSKRPELQIDWAQAWIERDEERSRPAGKEKWNKRAKGYMLHSKCKSGYTARFLEYLNLGPEPKTILDIGSGPGVLSIPLAFEGHTVYALDIAPNMLKVLHEIIESYDEPEKSLLKERIHTIEGAWESDWEALGIPEVDICIASRSTMVHDLNEAINKLNHYAKEKVAITVVAQASPKKDSKLYAAVGRDNGFGFDHLYYFNLLNQKGFTPEVRMICSTKNEKYQTKAEAFEKAREMLGDMTKEEQRRLKEFFDKHLIRHEEDGESYWSKDYGHEVRWAFMSWEPKSQRQNN